MNDLERALREAEIPDAVAARERARRTVLAAHRPVRRRPRLALVWVAVACGLAAIVFSARETGPARTIEQRMRNVFAAPAPAPTPAPTTLSGRLLVLDSGAVFVQRGGKRTEIGAVDGRDVVATRVVRRRGERADARRDRARRDRALVAAPPGAGAVPALGARRPAHRVPLRRQPADRLRQRAARRGRWTGHGCGRAGVAPERAAHDRVGGAGRHGHGRGRGHGEGPVVRTGTARSASSRGRPTARAAARRRRAQRDDPRLRRRRARARLGCARARIVAAAFSRPARPRRVRPRPHHRHHRRADRAHRRRGGCATSSGHPTGGGCSRAGRAPTTGSSCAATSASAVRHRFAPDARTRGWIYPVTASRLTGTPLVSMSNTAERFWAWARRSRAASRRRRRR